MGDGTNTNRMTDKNENSENRKRMNMGRGSQNSMRAIRHKTKNIKRTPNHPETYTPKT